MSTGMSRAMGSGLSAALFGATMLLAGAAGAGAATHFSPTPPRLRDVLSLLFSCPEGSRALPVAVFDLDDLAMFDVVAEPAP